MFSPHAVYQRNAIQFPFSKRKSSRMCNHLGRTTRLLHHWTFQIMYTFDNRISLGKKGDTPGPGSHNCTACSSCLRRTDVSVVGGLCRLGTWESVVSVIQAINCHESKKKKSLYDRDGRSILNAVTDDTVTDFINTQSPMISASGHHDTLTDSISYDMLQRMTSG